MPNENLAQQTSLSAINKRITQVAKSATAVLQYIHETAVMCVQHANDFGDCSSAARLVDAVPNAFRRSLLIGWFAAFSPISIAKNAKTGLMKAHLSGKADAKKGEEGFRDWNLEGAKATPFYAMPDAEREPDVPTYDSIHSNVVAFIKRMETRIKGKDGVGGIADKAERVKALAEVEKLKAAVAA